MSATIDDMLDLENHKEPETPELYEDIKSQRWIKLSAVPRIHQLQSGTRDNKSAEQNPDRNS